MSKRQSKWAYYSVTKPMRLNGVKRVPSVCYPIAQSEATEMEKLAEKGYVTLYAQRMRFQSGVAYIADADEDGPILVEAKVGKSKPKADSSSASSENEFAQRSGS